MHARLLTLMPNPLAGMATARNLTLAAGAAAIALAASVLVGWAFDIEVLKSTVPGLVTSKPNTAVITLICGLALTLLTRAQQPKVVRAAVIAIAAMAILISVLTMAQDALNLNFGIDEMLFTDRGSATDATSPGRMAPSAMFCFLLMGAALIVACLSERSRLRVPLLFGLGTAVSTIGTLAFFGHISAMLSGFTWWDSAGMAIPTSIGFVLLGCGVVGVARNGRSLDWSLNRLVVLGFAVGILSLVVATTLSYSYTRQLHTGAANLARAEDFIQQVQLVRTSLARLESGQRGYIITGDERLLENRRAIIRNLHDAFRSARRLVGGDRAQLEKLAELENLAGQRVRFGDRTIEVRRDAGFTAAKALLATETGIELTNEIEGRSRAIESSEYVLVGQERRKNSAIATATFLLLPLGTFVSLTISLLGLFFLNSAMVERRRTEKALQRSESDYRNVIEQASDGIFILDQSARFMLVNQRARELLGYTEDELIGKDNEITYVEAERPMLAQRIGQAQGGATLRYERMVRRKDGSAFPAEFSSRMLDNGAFQIIFHDITERRRTEALLRENEEKYRQLVQQASEGIFVLDAQARFVFANSRACDLLGYSERELVGADHAITYLPSDRHMVRERVAMAKTGVPLRYERMVLRKDGSSFPGEFSTRLISEGVAQVIFHDISERKRAESLLRESEERYRQLIEQASDGIFVSDAEGTFLMANSRGCDLLGYTHGEIIGMNGRATYVDEEREIHTQRMREVATGAVLRFDRMVRRKDGTFFPAEVSVKKLENGLVQVIFHDITERRKAERALRAERTLLRTLIDALPDLVFTKDLSGHFTMCNAAALAHSGFAREEEMVGKSVFDVYPRDIAARYQADDAKVLAGAQLLNHEEISIDHSGEQRWYLSIKVPLRNTGGDITGMVRVSRDITERKEQERKIARLNRIQAVLSGINSAIVRIRDREELFRETCRIAAMHGAFRIAWIGLREPSGAIRPAMWGGAGAEFFDTIMNKDVPLELSRDGVAMRALTEKRTFINNDITAGPVVDRVREEALKRGCASVIGLPLFANGQIEGSLVLYASEKDVFDEQEVNLLEELAGDVSFALTFIAHEKKVDYLAYYDTLTGLPNRTLFFDRLERQLAGAHRDGSQIALVLLDLDRFRMVNETVGRDGGDALLKAIAQRIKSTVREEDTVARMSADGFAIAASGDWRTQDLAHLIESRNRKLFEAPFLIGNEELRISATAGVVVYPGDAQTPEAMIANAEAALRSAKQQNVPLLFYGREMNEKAAESLRMENRLRRALEKNELALWYQPKIDAKTGKLKGFEALMRWNDPEVGMVPPFKFIPIMEQTGLIMEAGNWALSQVARDCANWSHATKIAPRVAVNVSPLQLRSKDFIANVIEASEQVDANGGLLDLEITESVIMENVDAIIPKLQTVNGLGVHIYVDDFGTGYSSLSYIARLPIYALKIDRSFVVGMTQSTDSLTIVMSVISLAHSLKLRVVAEGVETEEQAQVLRELRCDELQGYLFSRPVPPGEVPALLEKYS